ncbi:hypothetical protein WJ94_16010 [Burkholderia ubonensis]|uniref:hypothetical protein n=1 Tax=Burkholderia ubonensis TaxID=101571 RepID=UPI0007525CA9|nr:hypothetical protein [Burkholderia ubonensis]KVP76916.1 hypothetical protein WJ94_16010 [Burkholderia ubonensis]KVV12402.1 hypothetical protein WK77_06195 [Burkholderia ubonensis]
MSDQHFHVVARFGHERLEDWAVVGIYSKEEDAVEHAKRINPEYPERSGLGCVTKWSLSHLVDHLLAERLGCLHEVLRRIERAQSQRLPLRKRLNNLLADQERLR